LGFPTRSAGQSPQKNLIEKKIDVAAELKSCFPRLKAGVASVNSLAHDKSGFELS
jgi:hypothetical protein